MGWRLQQAQVAQSGCSSSCRGGAQGLAPSLPGSGVASDTAPLCAVAWLAWAEGAGMTRLFSAGGAIPSPHPLSCALKCQRRGGEEERKGWHSRGLLLG